MVPTKAGCLNNGVAGIVLLLAVAGCAGWGQWKEAPSINLASIRVLEVKGMESAFEIDLRVFNRNDRPLTIDGIDCTLDINGKRFAQGVANPRTEIPPYDSGIVTVTVFTSMLDMVGVVHRLIKESSDPDTLPTYTYRLKGNLRGGSGGFSGAIPFNSEGRMDIEELSPPPR
ncbi:MAG: LEA type 2 family protein [Desulfobacterales bacterium]|jgi:LEA14-like dessication related protein